MSAIKKLLDDCYECADISHICSENEISAAKAIVRVLIDNKCTIAQAEDIFQGILDSLKFELIISDNFKD